MSADEITGTLNAPILIVINTIRNFCKMSSTSTKDASLVVKRNVKTRGRVKIIISSKQKRHHLITGNQDLQKASMRVFISCYVCLYRYALFNYYLEVPRHFISPSKTIRGNLRIFFTISEPFTLVRSRLT